MILHYSLRYMLNASKVYYCFNITLLTLLLPYWDLYYCSIYLHEFNNFELFKWKWKTRMNRTNQEMSVFLRNVCTYWKGQLIVCTTNITYLQVWYSTIPKDMIKPTRIRVKLKNLKLVKLVTFIVEMTKHYTPTEPLMSGIIQSQYMEKRIINWKTWNYFTILLYKFK